MSRAVLLPLFLATAALGLSACGGGDDDTTAAATPAPAPAPSPAPAPAPSTSPSPAPAPGSGTGSAAECFNVAWYRPGTTWVLDYVISGNATGTTRSNGTVTGGKTFNGQAGLVEQDNDQTTTYTSPGTLAAAGTIPTRSRFYFTENGSVINSFGGTVAAGATVSGITVTTTTTTTYTPPRVDRRFTLAAATSDSFTSTSASSVTTNFGGAPTNTSTVQNVTINFAGQETVTVPAGTFVACKFLETINSDTNEQWYAKGSGAPIRYTSRTSEGQAITLSMTSASRLNGAAIAP